MKPIKIMLVAGTRPNFMKVAPLWTSLSCYPEFRPILVHTGQHYNPEMSAIFFRDLALPQPHVQLAAGSGSHAEQTAKIMTAFEPVLLKEEPEIIVVVGDVNSTLACALVAAKMIYPDRKRPKIAHVEAGLRSSDRTMPEEINRIVTDALADLLFATSRDAMDNLVREGIDCKKIFFVGNVMIDTLFAFRRKAEKTTILDRLGLLNGKPTAVLPYALCTLHRPSNVDDDKIFISILEALVEVGRQVPIIYPVHPRARGRLESLNRQGVIKFSSFEEGIDLRNPITCIEPLGYLEFLKLLCNARIVLTDSGGIQEETTVLGIPCVTLRANTERPITVYEGTNTLGGVETPGIVKAAAQALNATGNQRRVPERWDGRAAERIAQVLLTGNLND